MKNYKMCTLVQGPSITHGWIEERGARVGAFVEVLELGGFWEVTGVGDKVMTAEELTERRRRDKNSCLSIR